jgi:glycerol-3-phosphate dehydrogenase
MQRDLDRLGREEFDLLIVGGGISGVAMAHDAALRGLSVALVEKSDFGGATSAASSKLLHGGIRYLQQAQLAKVRESALERATFQLIAPHLTRYVPFLIPTDRSLLRGRTALSVGVALYELLSIAENRLIRDPAKRVPRSGRRTRDELLTLLPRLSMTADATGAHVIHESHMHSSERMTLAFVKTAAAHGAAVANYVAAEAFIRQGNTVRGLLARDEMTGRQIRIGARLVANATGPWIGGLNERLGVGPLTRRITGFSKGVHVVTRQLVPDVAVALPTSRRTSAVVTRGGRHVFVIPWRGLSLIGTTNTLFAGGPDDVRPTEPDVEELIADVRGALPGAGLDREDVRHAFAGLYPLTDEVLRQDVYQGTGEYQIVDHAGTDNVDGCISVLGAKFTTARRLAERAVDLAVRKLRRHASPCSTRQTPLAGGKIDDLAAFTADSRRRYPQFDPDVLDHLVASYGSELAAVVDAAGAHPASLERLSPDRESIAAEVEHAVAEEMALRLEDVVFRRTGLGTIGHPGDECLRRCATTMGRRLGWDPDRTAEEIRRVERAFSVGPRRGAPSGVSVGNGPQARTRS